MKLKNNQRNKMLDLTRMSLNILDNCKSDNKIFFSSPTGSGKTFILSNVCWNLINNYEKIVIFFASLSIGQIEKQNYENYIKYMKNSTEFIDNHFCSYLKNEKNILTSNSKDIKNIHKFSDRNKQIYFLGTQQFTKSSILFKENILKQKLEWFKENDYRIIYIRDEAHISKKSIYDNGKDSSQNLNGLFEKFANCSIYCSATINSLLSNSNTVIFTEKEAIDDCLIKDRLKSFFNIEENSSLTSEELTNICIDNFIVQKKLYKNLKYDINPAMLIQIPSKSSKHNEARERLLIKYLIGQLKTKNLNFVIWCDNFYDDIELTNVPELKNKDNNYIRKYISKNDSIVDVIIFKVALAIGWNIPRANTLLQLRELHSDDLNVQTIGRIRRNPLLNLDDIKKKEYNFCRNYFIYTNNITSKIHLKQISLKEEFQHFKIRHLKMLKKNMKINWDSLKKDLNHFLIDFININNLEKDTSNKYRIKKMNNISIEVFTNQFFWLNEFYKFFSEKLNSELFIFLEEFVNSWISKNNLKNYKHKIYRKLLDDDGKTIIDIINKNIDLSYNDYFQLDEHELPKTTQVELVLESKEKNFSNARTTLSLNKKYSKIHNKWAYNEVVNVINEWKMTNILNIKNLNDIQLDSHGEYECCNSVLEWISKNNKNSEDSILFTKHYISSSSIKYPYIHAINNELIKVHNTYPDFIFIANKNNELIYLIIEVKSKKNDYDKNKTQSIRNMFEHISKLDFFKKYYFCMYLYDGDASQRSTIKVYTGEKMNCDEFSDMNSLLDFIMR